MPYVGAGGSFINVVLSLVYPIYWILLTKFPNENILIHNQWWACHFAHEHFLKSVKTGIHIPLENNELSLEIDHALKHLVDRISIYRTGVLSYNDL